MMKRIWGVAILTLVLVACKKEPLPELPEDSGPYYSIKGGMDSEQIDLNVGQEGIKIDFGVSDINGIESYFGQISSPASDIEVKIEFVRPEIRVSSAGIQAFDLNNLGFLVHQTGCMNVDFGANVYQSNFMLVKDEIGNFQPVQNLTFEQFGVFERTFKFTDASQNSFKIPIHYGYESTDMSADFQVTGNGTNVIFAPATMGGTHQWIVNGDLVSNDAQFSDQFDIGVHIVQHIVTDAYQNSSTFTSLMRISDYVLDWKMSLTPCVPDLSNYGKVVVQVTKNGEVYRSDLSHQNTWKSFTIENEELVYNSEFEVDNAVFDFAFDAVVVNESQTDSLSLTGMTGRFNIGLK